MIVRQVAVSSMEGIRYVTDENNKKVAVQLSYEVYGESLDDLIDGLIAES